LPSSPFLWYVSWLLRRPPTPPPTTFMSDLDTDRTRVGRLMQTARALLAKGGSLESSGESAPLAQNDISLALEQYVRQSGVVDDIDPKLVATEVLSQVKSALDKSPEDETQFRLSDEEWSSLEAIVQVTGRPALGYKEEQVEMPNEVGANQHWAVLIATARTTINQVSSSVGRVSRKSKGTQELIGTAWRIGESLVVTNRHVAARLVFQPNDPISSWELEPGKIPRVCFDASGLQEFSVKGIVYCSPEDAVDLAILQLDCGGNTPPPPLRLDWAPESIGVEIFEPGEPKPTFKGKQIYLVGHPYHRVASNAVAKVFGNADGSKRFSPGYVTSIEETELEHDCSTLGGNSGSCVLSAGSHRVVGLHHGSREVDRWSGRGSANVALAFSRLPGGPATAILKSGRA